MTFALRAANGSLRQTLHPFSSDLVVWLLLKFVRI